MLQELFMLMKGHEIDQTFIKGIIGAMTLLSFNQLDELTLIRLLQMVKITQLWSTNGMKDLIILI